ncbi:DUF4145 domain-containing protein [Bacillus haynesii]|uniref:DUF4145 domain-containing protein n=1 Tax=Bacillus haynesii TaxID=1925021 RepID=UPI002280BD5E|nr:DUF4145 domain-containing protein [Bacillus haynesii]MCY9226219.1 DUF4145 domain-containing protein [Bacillus haynesii]
MKLEVSLRCLLELLSNPKVGRRENITTARGKKGKINDMIGEVVGKGLPHRIQMALDSLRVIGNEAVHPGKIDLDGIDGKETAVALFGVLNFVVEKMLTEPREIEDIYSLLPDSTKKGIDERDNKALTKQ